MAEKMLINDDYKIGASLKKGTSGGAVVSLALVVMSCFHGLTPAQQNVGIIVLSGVFESVRNLLKKNYPRWFRFL
jgi:hypothetical protein